MKLALRLATAILICLVLAPAAWAQDVVFVVRHAERADAGMQNSMGSDPPLSAAGEARAKALATMLREADIKRVFATEFKRTQQTADPTAKMAHVEVTTVPSKEVATLLEKLKSPDGAALVVGHSNTVPDVLEALGVKQKIKIPDNEYDNLFIVVRSGTEATLVKLRF